MLACHLRDVHETLDAVAQVDKGTKGDELGNNTLNDSANRILLDENTPRILGGLLETQGDALTVEIHIENLNLNFLTDLNNLGGVVNVVPRELRDVNQTIDTAKVDKSTEVDDGGNLTLEVHARLELGEDVGTLGLASLLKNNTARKDNVVAVTVHLDNTSLNTRAHECCEILDAAKVNKRSRQEATQANVKDKTTLNNLNNFAFDVLVSVEFLLDTIPSTFVLSALLGENQTAFLVLLLEN